MQILKNQTIINRQSDLYMNLELSNVAAIVQSQQILVDYYSCDADASTTNQYGAVEEYIGPDSTMVYNHIEKLPMGGLDTLIAQSQFDEDMGYNEDFSSSATIFPNTIVPKPYDFFIVEGTPVPSLYVVTGTSPVTVRSNPFVEITFKLYSRDKRRIDQLNRQVKEHYITTFNAIGQDKSIVISKTAYTTIQDHVAVYMEISEMYKALFFNKLKGAFMLSPIYDQEAEHQINVVDIVMWAFMFNEGIIAYDDVCSYANDNFDFQSEKIFISPPDQYITQFDYTRSIIYRIFKRITKFPFSDYRYPNVYAPDTRVTKFRGKNIVYFDKYTNIPDCGEPYLSASIWDDEFVSRIRENNPYDLPINLGDQDQNINPYLRNAIINWYNGKEIDFDSIILTDEQSNENFYLIPLLLGAYKQFIINLQK